MSNYKEHRKFNREGEKVEEEYMKALISLPSFFTLFDFAVKNSSLLYHMVMGNEHND